ncbi:Glycerophosphoryl diester phosphodiesterase [Anaerohalosphaera lusitana]|uniref:Glycerophosphoryl diester phosphodiesterase n=2 Tax=Anaerohalosphaera lusitana TaxID=1936003 RepID=A0A1U9NIR0_9BACT|nr:Glycerophosphoryl diester phosphodiesterase [Anaerohalosphaera lusitana]
MASVRSAWDAGADGVEVDVHMTRDGEVVVIHDADTGRTGDRRLVVKDSTYDELRAVDVGGGEAGDFAGERIPRLGEVIETLPAGKRLFVEVKCGGEIVQGLRRVIEGSGKEGQIAVICLAADVLELAAGAMPGVKMYWVLGSREDDDGEYAVYDDALIGGAAERGFDGLDVYHEALTAEYVEKAKRAGLEIYVWGVNELAAAERMLRIGVDGVTTDYPADVMRMPG